MSAITVLDRIRRDRENALASIEALDAEEARVLSRLDEFPALLPYAEQPVPEGHERAACPCGTPTFLLTPKYAPHGALISQGDILKCSSCRLRDHVAQLVREGKMDRAPSAPWGWADLAEGAAFDPGPVWIAKGVQSRIKDGIGDELLKLVRRHLATPTPGAGRLVRTIADATAEFREGSYSTRRVAGPFFIVTATRNPQASTAEGAMPLTFVGLADGESFGVLASC